MTAPMRLVGIGVLAFALTSCGGAGEEPADAVRGPVATNGVAPPTDGSSALAGDAATPPAGDETQERAAALPATASPLPFTALVGVLSLAGAAGLRLLRGRSRASGSADEGTA